MRVLPTRRPARIGGKQAIRRPSLIPAVAAPCRRRAWLPLAVLVQRLVQLHVDTAVTLNLDPTRPSGYSIYLRALQPFHSFALVTVVAARDGPAGRRDDLRAGQAPVRRARVARGGHDAAGALRRVRDPARAPDLVRHAVPVPGDAGGHGAAVVAACRRCGAAGWPGCSRPWSAVVRSHRPAACFSVFAMYLVHRAAADPRLRRVRAAVLWRALAAGWRTLGWCRRRRGTAVRRWLGYAGCTTSSTAQFDDERHRPASSCTRG